MHILVVDTQALLSRAIFAFEQMGYKTQSGIPTHGVYGFFKILLKEIRVFRPNVIICCNDTRNGFRKVFSKENNGSYKASRSNSDFRYLQSMLVEAVLTQLGIPVLSVPAYEADDVVATVTRNPQAITIDGKPLDKPLFKILSGDKDLLQLIKPDVQMYLWKSSSEHRLITTNEDVKREISVNPDQILDYKAMVGDTSDEIPGVSKFGKKGSEEFFSNYYSYAEGLLDEFSKLSNRSKNALLRDPEGYSKSRYLATLYDIKNFRLDLITRIDQNKYSSVLLHDLECKSLGSDLMNHNYIALDYKMFGSSETPIFGEA